MNLFDLLLQPLAYEFFVRALIASALVGVACAVVGAFVVLKGMSFIGDAVSHSAFPGIVIAYLLGLPIILGGAVAAIATRLQWRQPRWELVHSRDAQGCAPMP